MLVKITEQNKEEILTTTSRQISENFEKEHSEIIYAIEGRIRTEGKIKNNGLIPQLIETGISQVEKYFIETEYVSRGKKYKEYLITRDGFSLLVIRDFRDGW